MRPMRIKCIACEVLSRGIYYYASQSPHVIDVELLKHGLHERSHELRQILQAKIDEASSQSYEVITLAYGLCGQATAGLIARQIPVVIPRAHDCITLFLGSRSIYQQQFEKCPGTYWYAADYVERNDGNGTALSMGSASETDLQATYQEYVQKYGQDNADYLMEVMGGWQKHYQRAAYIDHGFAGSEMVEERARSEAEHRGWSYECIAGDLVLLRKLLQGDWGEDFLVVPPGQTTSMSYDDEILNTRPEE